MNNVLSYVSQFFDWLGDLTSLFTSNVIIITLVFLGIGIPLLISVIRRYLL